MELKYKDVLSPVRVRNTILRNRFIGSPAMPMFMQASEHYPSKAMIDYYVRKAKEGLALMVCGGGLIASPEVPVTQCAPNWPAKLDAEGWQNRNQWCQLVEGVHFAGAKILMHLRTTNGDQVPPGYDVSEGESLVYIPEVAEYTKEYRKAVTLEMMEARAEDLAQNAFYWKMCGFDGVMLHCSYRAFLEGRFLSKLINQRTDEFGGSPANRARYVKMICKRIKELCGPDFLIQMDYSATDAYEGGNEIEDSIAIIHELEDYVDIVENRCGDMDAHHTIGTCPEKTPFLHLAAQLKASNPKCLISCGGGFQDLDICNEAIASGKVDMISAARAWIADYDYGKKAYAGLGEEVVPCIRCNKCHGNVFDQWGGNMCSVNPRAATITNKLDILVEEPGPRQKVAVIGGGPAGMQAALTAASRGHEITIFEKAGHLGGALSHSDFCKSKWPLRDYMHYQIRHVEQHKDITVKLHTEATPELIADMGFDRVIVALGGKPLYPPIKGITEDFVTYAEDAFGHHEDYGRKVVVIGGGEIGVDVGVYFAENGHEAFVLEMNPRLAMTAQPVHYWSLIMRHWESEPTFSYAVNAQVLEVTPKKVIYRDGDGNIQEVTCDNVILAAGKVNQIDAALSFAGTAQYVEQVGDCVKVADLKQANRAAYAAATRF